MQYNKYTSSTAAGGCIGIFAFSIEAPLSGTATIETKGGDSIAPVGRGGGGGGGLILIVYTSITNIGNLVTDVSGGSGFPGPNVAQPGEVIFIDAH